MITFPAVKIICIKLYRTFILNLIYAHLKSYLQKLSKAMLQNAQHNFNNVIKKVYNTRLFFMRN